MQRIRVAPLTGYKITFPLTPYFVKNKTFSGWGGLAAAKTKEEFEML